MTIDCDFPGGNILVDAVEGDTLAVRQDLRDTAGHWFYWYFRVRGAAGRTLTVRFTDGNVIGVRGPGVSLDAGRTWCWLGAEAVDGASFRYRVPADAGEVRFSMGMPYLEADLKAFLERHRRDTRNRLRQRARGGSERGVSPGVRRRLGPRHA